MGVAGLVVFASHGGAAASEREVRPEGFPDVTVDLQASGDGTATFVGANPRGGPAFVWRLGSHGEAQRFELPAAIDHAESTARGDADDVLWVAGRDAVACRTHEGAWHVTHVPTGLTRPRIAALEHARAAFVAAGRSAHGSLAYAALLACGRAVPERAVAFEDAAFKGAVASGVGFTTLMADYRGAGGGFVRVAPDAVTVSTTRPEALAEHLDRLRLGGYATDVAADVRALADGDAPSAGYCTPVPASDRAGGFFAWSAQGSAARICHVDASGASRCAPTDRTLVALAFDAGRAYALATRFHPPDRWGFETIAFDDALAASAAPLPARALEHARDATTPCPLETRRLDAGGGVFWVVAGDEIVASRGDEVTIFVSRASVAERRSEAAAPYLTFGTLGLTLAASAIGSGALASRVHDRPVAASSVEAAAGSLLSLPAMSLVEECSPSTHHFGRFGSGVAVVCETFAVPAAGLSGALGTSLTNELAFGGSQHAWAGFGGAVLGGTIGASLALLVVDPLLGPLTRDEPLVALRVGLQLGLVGLGAALGHEAAGGPPRR